MNQFGLLLDSYKICLKNYQAQIQINWQRDRFFISFISVITIVNWLFLKLAITPIIITVNVIGYGVFICGIQACRRIAKQKILIGKELRKSPNYAAIQPIIQSIEEALKIEYSNLDPTSRLDMPSILKDICVAVSPCGTSSDNRKHLSAQKLQIGTFNHYISSIFILLLIINIYSLGFLLVSMKSN